MPASTRSAASDAALEELRDYHRRENLWEHVDADIRPGLAALRARGLRLVVVSNANGRLRHLFDRLDLTRWFDHLLDSHDWGVEKPDPRLFQLALAQAGADASRTVHVGDLYHVDIAGRPARRPARRPSSSTSARLYADADCPRVATMGELVEWLEAGK